MILSTRKIKDGDYKVFLIDLRESLKKIWCSGYRPIVISLNVSLRRKMITSRDIDMVDNVLDIRNIGENRVCSFDKIPIWADPSLKPDEYQICYG